MTTNRFILLLAALGLLSALQTCKRTRPGKNFNDSYHSGSAVFAADESFAPILDQELYIFKHDNPQANIKMLYRPENEVLKLLMEDSVRFVCLARPLTQDEINTLRSRSLITNQKRFAIDAIAVIVNAASADTATSIEEIKKMLKGEAKTDRSIVFDNPNSSLVRYLKDFAGIQDLKQKNIYALKSNKEVIEYVSKHPEAIGITGFNWLDDPDPDYADAVKNVRILAVKNENDKKAPNQYFRPSQSSLALQQYPLARSLYLVNCTGRKGLGLGFELFVEDDRGQRIILRSGLLPVIVQERNITIHSDKL